MFIAPAQTIFSHSFRSAMFIALATGDIFRTPLGAMFLAPAQTTFSHSFRGAMFLATAQTIFSHSLGVRCL